MCVESRRGEVKGRGERGGKGEGKERERERERKAEYKYQGICTCTCAYCMYSNLADNTYCSVTNSHIHFTSVHFSTHTCTTIDDVTKTCIVTIVNN